MDEQQDRKAQTRKLGRRGKGGGMTPKENNLIPIYVITSDGKEMKVTGDKFLKLNGNNVEMKAKGGRVGLKSGSKGCKLAMKGKGRAYGKNS